MKVLFFSKVPFYKFAKLQKMNSFIDVFEMLDLDFKQFAILFLKIIRLTGFDL